MNKLKNIDLIFPNIIHQTAAEKSSITKFVFIEKPNSNAPTELFKFKGENEVEVNIDKNNTHESYRVLGGQLCTLKYLNVNEDIIFKNQINDSIVDYIYAFIEGFLHSYYRFIKYKSIDQKSTLNWYIDAFEIPLTTIKLWKNIYSCRDLINEPSNALNSITFKEYIIEKSIELKYSVQVMDKKYLLENNMGGIIAVNQGSTVPPFLIEATYEPENATNSQWFVLVGKGVTYDTGGLSIKPTPNSMDIMKCDMGGAATVLSVFHSIVQNSLPIKVKLLIPLTDNRVSADSISPGDVITMHNQKTVEVMNTDAEGRLILADALAYAQQFNPALVIDMATLTGAAARAIGKEAMVYMGTHEENLNKVLIDVALKTDEKVVQFPLWDEYKTYIESTIADIKNIGGAEAGAITAGMFLKEFINYPWIHFDIAGNSFLTSKYKYYPVGATGIGVKLIYEFVLQLIEKKLMK